MMTNVPNWVTVLVQARGGQWITDVEGDPWSYDAMTLGNLLDRGLITYTDSRNHYVLTEQGEWEADELAVRWFHGDFDTSEVDA